MKKVIIMLLCCMTLIGNINLPTYAANTVNVIFNANGGTLDANVFGKEFYATSDCGAYYEVGAKIGDSTVVQDPVPAVAGTAFRGWMLIYEDTATGNYPQVPGTSIFTTQEMLNYVVPSGYNTLIFLAVWENDSSGGGQGQENVELVEVFFNANGGTVKLGDDRVTEPVTGIGLGYIKGKTLAEQGVTLEDPVFNPSTRKFAGWRVCSIKEVIGATGNVSYEYEQIPGMKLLTTNEVLNYVLTDRVAFLAEWEGSAEDYTISVELVAWYGELVFLEMSNGQAANEKKAESFVFFVNAGDTGLQKQIERAWVYKSGPTKKGATFEGWLEFQRYPYTGPEPEKHWFYYRLVSEELLTTEEILTRPIPNYDVVYAAKWSDMELWEYYPDERYPGTEGSGGSTGSGGGQNSGGSETPGSGGNSEGAHNPGNSENPSGGEQQPGTGTEPENTTVEIEQELTEVPEEIKDQYAEIEDVKDALMEAAKDSCPEFSNETYEIEFVDICVFFTKEDGTVEKLSFDNIPEEGVSFIFPYPEGTNAEGFDFVITHMITAGERAGQVEVLEYTKEAEGLRVKVNSFSPFMIAYAEVEDIDESEDETVEGEQNVQPDSDGDGNDLLIILAIVAGVVVLAVGFGIVYMKFIRKR